MNASGMGKTASVTRPLYLAPSPWQYVEYRDWGHLYVFSTKRCVVRKRQVIELAAASLLPALLGYRWLIVITLTIFSLFTQHFKGLSFCALVWI